MRSAFSNPAAVASAKASRTSAKTPSAFSRVSSANNAQPRRGGAPARGDSAGRAARRFQAERGSSAGPVPKDHHAGATPARQHGDDLWGDPRKLMDSLPRKPISSVPKFADWAPFAFVIDSFLLRTRPIMPSITASDRA